MATEIFNNGRVTLTQFWGGEKRGVCVQVTQLDAEERGGYVQLTKEDAAAVADALNEWCWGTKQRLIEG